MKVNVQLKIEFLEGEEAGKVETSTTIAETETRHTAFGVVESLKLGWSYTHPIYIHEHIREEDSRE